MKRLTGLARFFGALPPAKHKEQRGQMSSFDVLHELEMPCPADRRQDRHQALRAFGDLGLAALVAPNEVVAERHSALFFDDHGKVFLPHFGQPAHEVVEIADGG